MAQPDDITIPDADEQDAPVVHHVSQRKKRRKDKEPMELQLTSMIDVIFQLLIYFVITANFQIDEGTIRATMPGQSAPPTEQLDPPDPPIFIDLITADDGVTYTLRVDQRTVPGGASELYGYLQGQVAANKIDLDADIQIRPAANVRWQHVVNVFNACARADLEKVGFATPN